MPHKRLSRWRQFDWITAHNMERFATCSCFFDIANYISHWFPYSFFLPQMIVEWLNSKKGQKIRSYQITSLGEIICQTRMFVNWDAILNQTACPTTMVHCQMEHSHVNWMTGPTYKSPTPLKTKVDLYTEKFL